MFNTPDANVATPDVPVVVKLVNGTAGITGVGIFNTPLTRVAASPEAPVVVKLTKFPPGIVAQFPSCCKNCPAVPPFKFNSINPSFDLLMNSMDEIGEYLSL